MPTELDLDVLGLVCHAVDHVPAVLALSVVSHCFRRIASQRLLSMKPIALKDERSIRAFHWFVFANPDSRLPFVRALSISINKLEDDARQQSAQRILDILEHVTHLESLTLPSPHWTLKYLADPRIPEAIIRLPNLRELGLLDQCDEMERIVQSTHSASTLRILRISLFTLPSLRDVYGITLTQLDALLCRLSPTLEVLETRGTGLTFDAKGTPYPALRSFTAMAAIDEGILRMDTLVAKFPALEDTLDVGGIYGVLQDDPPERRRIRTSNQEQQEHQSWKHLDCVEGDVLALFMLGLTCPVRRLVAQGFCDHVRDELAEILRATPPTHLQLSCILDHGDRFFRDLFPAHVTPRLTHLVLVLEYTNPPVNDEQSDEELVRTIQLTELLAKIIQSIQSLRLTHFRLLIHYRIDLHDRNCRPYSKGFVRSILDLAHGQLAAELMDAAPSLRYVLLSTGGELRVHEFRLRGRWFAHSAWRTAKSSRHPSRCDPQELDEDVMERMWREEDLALSDEDNSSLGFEETWTAEQTAPWPLPE